jgi:uncharacterized membrane protein
MATPTDTFPALPGAGPAASASRWAERAPLVVGALCGVAVASHLALVQLGVVAKPWDPLFGAASSLRVLRSSFSRALPVPDAAVGAVAYLAEAVLAAWGGTARWRTHPWRVVASGAVAAALAAAGVLLVFLQVAVIRAGCALCLASAAISFSIALVARHEVRAAIRVLRRGHPSRERA